MFNDQLTRFSRWVASIATVALMAAGSLVPVASATDGSVRDIIGRAERHAPVTAPLADAASAGMTVTAGDGVGVIDAGSRGKVRLAALDSPNSVVRERTDGIQALTVLHEGSTARFSVDLPTGQVLTPAPDGSFLVTNEAQDKVYGFMRAPWAIDAKGKSLPTSFTVNGDEVTQTIDTRDAMYPITADPWLSWYWNYVNLNLWKTEVQQLARYTDYWQLAAAVCTKFVAWWAQALCGVLVGAYAITWSNSIKSAARYGQCWYMSIWTPAPWNGWRGSLRGWGGFRC